MAGMDKCIDAAVAHNLITAEDGTRLKERYKEIAKMARTDSDIRAALASEIGAEAAYRERRALLTETVRKRLLTTLADYRNLKGQADMAEAFVALHENFGRTGSYIADAGTLHDVIRNEATGEMADLLRAFRKGAITGDLRRGQKAVAADMAKVVRELFGENTGDARAKAMAEAFTTVAEKLRLRFNKAGGAIGKLEKWGLPQGHSMDALLDYGQAKWVDYMMQPGVLDRERTVHPLTKRKLTDDELRSSLRVIWDRITTDGWSDREVEASFGRGALWSQHADHRYLHFKNADAWMAYAKAFGNPDPFSAMMHHIGLMSRDIAHMETFGPNPTILRSYIANYLRSQAGKVMSNEVVLREQIGRLKELAGKLTKPNPDFVALSDRIGAIHTEIEAMRRKSTPQLGGKLSKRNAEKIAALDAELMAIEKKLVPYWDDPKLQTIEDQGVRLQMQTLLEDMRSPVVFAPSKRPTTYAGKMIDKANAMWDLQRGSLAPEDRGFANVMASIRNIISSSSLGGALLSSMSDPAFGQDVRMRFGMGMARSNFVRIMGAVIKEMVTMTDRDTAIRLGLGLDSAHQMMHRKAYESRTFDGRAWTGFVADRVLTLGGLSPWTQAGKHAVGLDLMGFLHDVKDRAFADLPADTQKALTSHGFDAASWDAIRAADSYEPKAGARYLRATEIEAAAGRELAERYLGMILRETRYAVPEATVASRVFSIGGLKPGTAQGELYRSMMQFKGFGIAVVMLHAGRMAREIMAGDTSAYRRAAALMITSAVLGAYAMALKDVAAGRDPRKWLDEKTYLDPQLWGAAILQAGGLGIYGDFLFSNTGRHNQSFGTTLAGPLMSRLDNIMGLTMGNLAQRVRGEKTNIGRETTRAIRENIPGANWPIIGLVFQRVLMDSLQKVMDPEAHLAFRHQIMTRRKDYNQDYWWTPGETTPRRAPDLGRIIAKR